MFNASYDCAIGGSKITNKDEYIEKLKNSKLLDRRLKRTVEYQYELVNRQSIVLVLSSLILAFPYKVLPEIAKIVVVVAACSNDPSPIQESVRHTFREFKRTHQDNWENDKQMFTDEELRELGDLLISQSYYA